MISNQTLQQATRLQSKENHFVSIRLSIIIILLIVAIQSVSSQVTILWNYNNLSYLKSHQNSYRSLISDIMSKGDRHANSAPLSITSKPNIFVKDTHYYASLAIYYWPDPNNSSNAYIHRDGNINPEYKQYDAGKLEQLSDRMKYLSLAYYFTGDNIYLKSYLRQLDVWFLSKDTYMYPRFDYAQIAPGHNGNRGRPYGLIEAYNFNTILESIRLIDSLSGINSKRMKALRKWFRKFGDWMEKDPLGKEERSTLNNHSIAYDVLLLNIRLFSDNKLDESIINNFYPIRLSRQVMSDGSQPHELNRPRAMHYSVYNLSHIIDFYTIMNHFDSSYFESSQPLLTKAFTFLLQYDKPIELFPYKENASSWSEERANLRFEYGRFTRLGNKTTTGDRLYTIIDEVLFQ